MKRGYFRKAIGEDGHMRERNTGLHRSDADGKVNRASYEALRAGTADCGGQVGEEVVGGYFRQWNRGGGGGGRDTDG
jgi:hypothetical protein